MAQAETVQENTDAVATSIMLGLNEALLGYADSPWFRALERSAITLGGSKYGSSTVWGIPAEDGAMIFATRYWDYHEAPVGIDGANEVELSLQRPGETVNRNGTGGPGYYLWPNGAGSGLQHDGYAEQQCENEVLGWAGVDSPEALVGYIADAINRGDRGNVSSVMHRTWTEYGMASPKGRTIRIFADKEVTVLHEQSATDRSLDLVVSTPATRRSAFPWLSISGEIAQTDQKPWEITKFEAIGAAIDVGSYEDRIHQLTPKQWQMVWSIGEATLNRCITDANELYSHALKALAAESTEAGV